MNIEEVREVCLSIHPEVSEETPFIEFGSPDIAYKIGNKIFAFLLTDGSNLLVLKCNADRAVELRDKYIRKIEPAFHWNKKYWNQIHFTQLPEQLVTELINHSFNEVVAKLTKKLRAELGLQ